MKLAKRMLGRVIPESMVAPSLFLLVFQLIVYSGTKAVTASWHHYSMETKWDRMVPFLPWTVAIYCSAFVLWTVWILMIVRGDKDRAYRFLAADVLCKAVSAVIFLLMPTANVRPQFEVTNFWEWGLHVIYTVDAADDLFPSLHCLLSWLCFRAFLEDPDISRGHTVFCGVATVLICISTVTTRQHVLADVISGVLLAEVMYRLCGNRKVTRFYYRMFDR